jgi:VanZ family protein
MVRPVDRIHLAVFALFLIAWTIALLMPVPHESAEKVLGDSFGVFLFGKSLHIGSYTFLTVLGGTVAIFGRRWWWVLPGLLIHGSLIEIIQPHVGRTGRIEDVGLDLIGIVIGGFVILGWQRFTSRANLETQAAAESSPPHQLPTMPPTHPTSADSR